MVLSIGPCPGGGGTLYTTQQCIHDSVTGTVEEIITTSGGGGWGGGTYCTKSTAAAANMPGTAFAEKCYTRNSQGDLYSIYGTGAMPYTIGGQPAQQGQTAVSWADPQIFQYLNQSAPGSYSRFMQQHREMPWYTNTFGTRKGGIPKDEYEEILGDEDESAGFVEWIKSMFSKENEEEFNAGGWRKRVRRWKQRTQKGSKISKQGPGGCTIVPVADDDLEGKWKVKIYPWYWKIVDSYADAEKYCSLRFMAEEDEEMQQRPQEPKRKNMLKVFGFVGVVAVIGAFYTTRVIKKMNQGDY